MTATITAKTSDIVHVLKLLACPYGGEYLYSPLRLNIADGRIGVLVQSQMQTSYLKADVSVGKVEGSGVVVVNPEHLLKFLDLYGADEEVAVSLGDPITIRGATRTSTIHPQDVATVQEPNFPAVTDGKVVYKTGPTTTQVFIDSKEVAGVVDAAKVVEVASFPLKFGPDGSSVALGTGEAKRNSVVATLNCKVEGEAAETLVGEDLAYIFDNVAGEVQLQLKRHDKRHPLAIFRTNPYGTFAWVVLPRDPKPT